MNRITEFIRPCSRCGQIACRKLDLRDVVDHDAVSEEHERGSEKRDRRLSGGAAGISSIVGAKMNAEPTIVGPTPNRAETRVAVSAAASEPMLDTQKTSPIVAGRELELAHCVDEEDREGEARRRSSRCAVQAAIDLRLRVPEHEAEPLLAPRAASRDAARRPRALGTLLPLADAEEEEARPEKAERVEEHRVRRRDQLDEDAAQSGPRRSGLPSG